MTIIRVSIIFSLALLICFSCPGASYVTTRPVNHGPRRLQLNPQKHVQSSLFHEVKYITPFRRVFKFYSTAPHYIEKNHNKNMSENDEQDIHQKINELRYCSTHALSFINDTPNNSFLTRGELGIIVLAHALHLSGIAIGLVMGKFILETQLSK